MGVFSRADTTPTRHRYVGLCESVQKVTIVLDTLQYRVGAVSARVKTPYYYYTIFLFTIVYLSQVYLLSQNWNHSNSFKYWYCKSKSSYQFICSEHNVVIFFIQQYGYHNGSLLLRCNGYKLLHREVWRLEKLWNKLFLTRDN